MALEITNVPDPTASTPVSSAYSKIALIALDTITGAGRAEVGIFRDAAAAAAAASPLERYGVPLGGVVVLGNPNASPPVTEVRFPTLAQYMSDPQFAAAFNYIRTKLYDDLKALVPRFAGASDV